MDLGPLVPFRPETEGEGFRQVVGTILAPDRYYAVICPDDAGPMDGEHRLMIRDDAFGADVLQSDISFSTPVAFLQGSRLADPVDAILVDWDGYVLFLRDGQMRVEKIPGLGDNTQDPENYRAAGAAAIIDGTLWVASSGRKIHRRLGPSNWVQVAPNLEEPRDLDVAKVFFPTSIAQTSNNEIVIAGYRDYGSVVLAQNSENIWREILPPRGWLSDIAVTTDDRVVISARLGDIWQGTPDGGFAPFLRHQSTHDFNAIASFEDTIYLAGPDGLMWSATDGALTELRPFVTDEIFTITTFEVTDLGLTMSGLNGFGIYDGKQWQHVQVPW